MTQKKSVGDKIQMSAVVIIGSLSGIGRTIAFLTARDGLVVLVGRSREALDELAAEIGGTGRRAIALSIDLPEPVSVKRIADALAERQLDGTNLSIVPASACSALKLGPIGLSN